MQKTQYPGVEIDATGKIKLTVTAMCPRTQKRLYKRKTLPAGTPLEDALTLKEELKRQLLRDAEEPTRPRIMLAGYAKTWIEAKVKRLKPRAQSTYICALEYHILPQLGDIYVDAFIRADVESWVAWAEAQLKDDGTPYSSHTLKGWWRVLKMLLQDAAADFNIPDPTSRVRPPQTFTKPRRERMTLSAVQLQGLLTAMEHLDATRALEAKMLAYTGMRVGELYALHWDDVDGETLHVRRSVSQGHITTTKTGVGRMIYLPAELQQLLFAHRASLIKAQHIGLEAGLIFPSDQGTPRTPSYLSKLLKEAAQLAQIPIQVSPQVLRRTFNTLLVMAGVDRIVLRAQMGHTTEAMTERYAGVPLERKKQAFEKVFQ